MTKLRPSSLVLGSALLVAACGAACGSGSGAGGGTGGVGDAGNDATLSGGGDGGGGLLHGDDGGGGGDGSGSSSGGSNPCVAPSQLTIAPAGEVSAVTVGTPFTQAFTASATYGGGSPVDVTAQTFFSIGGSTAGAMSGSTFTWGGTSGGVVTVTGQTCGVTSSTTLTLKLSVIFGTGSGEDGGSTFGDAGGAPGEFSDAGVTSTTSCNPSLIYPPDGVLLPPNTNVIEIQFMPGSPPNTQFEISFENASTDVRIFTPCNPLNGGCVFSLDQAEWDYVASTNAGGDPVTVQVLGLGCDGANVGVSNTRHVSFAQEDVVGTLYYWASINLSDAGAGPGPGPGPGGGGVFSGGVFRYDFGVRGQTATPVLTPTYGGDGFCIGCHDISRDGRLMLFDYDDNDADDEYGDVNTDVFDVAARTFATGGLAKNQAFEPGFHTWTRTHSAFLLSDGANLTGTGKPSGSFSVRSADAGLIDYTPAPPATIRGTNPDMAPDDSHVVFAAAPYVESGVLADGGAAPGYWQAGGVKGCDEWFAGSSLYTTPWSDTTNQVGAESLLLQSNGVESFYYPSYSPDGTLVVFNHAARGPNFHNPLARVQVVKAGVASPTPDDLAKLNDDPTNGGLVTNSWARWAPFVQSYKGGQILWLTMSSTRDYGLRIQNDGLENCYPTESPNGAPYSTRAFTTNNLSPGCTRAQLWMAAIKLDANGVATGVDVSYPPFWLPFQDLGTNNHLGQWAQQAFSGTCSVSAADAGAAPDAGGCAPGLCCFGGGCAPCLPPPPPPPPPPATCAINANCATGTCCNSGSCGACPGADAGGSGGNDSGASGPPCNTCLDCSGLACNGGQCGACTDSTQCCAPSSCVGGQCVLPAK